MPGLSCVKGISPEYYDNARVTAWLEQQGIHEVSEGDHDTVHYTVTMMLVDLS